MTEPAWWQSFVDGELAGFGHLIETYQRHVFAVALATVIDRSLAEDVVQETFLAAHEHRRALRDPGAVSGWLASIARNKGHDLLRAHRRESLIDVGELEMATSDDSSPHRDIETAALRNGLAHALARVPASLREALVLYYAHDHSAEHVARELGLSEAATMQRLSRGRKLMRHHAAALEEYVRPRRAAAAAIIALLAVRSGQAHAAPPRTLRPPMKLLVLGATGCALVFGWTLVDQASARSPDRASPVVATADVEPSANAAPAQLSDRSMSAVTSTPAVASHVDVATAKRGPVAVIAPAATNMRIEVDTAAPLTADTRVGVAAEAELHVAVPPHAAPVVDLCPCPGKPAIVARKWDPANAFVETAAMPRPADVMFEMIAFDWIVRVGLTEHLAVHAAFTPIETGVGDDREANPAFGGGVKIGGHLSEEFSLAVVGEAAHEVRLGTLSVGEAWIGRTYASLTRGNARSNATASAGVVGRDDRSKRYVSPMVALGSQYGWDDGLAFVVEWQWFPRPLASLSSTTTFAARFRHQDSKSPFLGINRTRIDIGAVLVETTDDIVMAPWLQVGFGW